MSKRTGYQTSLSGLVGALVLCLLLIIGYVGFRAFTRDELSVQPNVLDYRPVVQQYQQGGEKILYPETLPEGWRATSIDNTPGQRPTFGLGILTDEVDGRTQFVGYKWSDVSASSLATRAMGEDVREGDEVALETPNFPGEWTEWSHGTDTGYSIADQGRTLLVWGSISREQMVTFINTLTTEKVAD